MDKLRSQAKADQIRDEEAEANLGKRRRKDRDEEICFAPADEELDKLRSQAKAEADKIRAMIVDVERRQKVWE